MKLLRETLEFLKSPEFFTGVIDRMFALLVTVVFFIGLALAFIYKPVVLLYVLVAGMLVLGWFMLYFIFPEVHEWIQAGKLRVTRFIKRLK